MKILRFLILWGSPFYNLTLIKAELIPQLINTLNPYSLSLSDCEDIHTSLISTITSSLIFTIPDIFQNLGIEDHNEQQTGCEMVLQQVLEPSEKYLWHLCVNRNSIIDGDQSSQFIILFANLLQISPYHRPTMDLVLSMPVFLAMPSCLTFFENDDAISTFLYIMPTTQWKWNRTQGDYRQIWITVYGMLRKEGIEDAIEEKLQNDQDDDGEWIVRYAIGLNRQHGTNFPQLL
ncbi:hypothetical protein BLNAU_3362 [Blattamonas nauphoetae]|uniref:Uncharacterized protein n=1 Tax=Blattamonas nauphoetae TaxID=2049346 RepID=A0ABQ9YD81_9EUKA|nr:hypothetical protein BLNAU_3362 [Blattamonas nauphoetae]